MEVSDVLLSLESQEATSSEPGLPDLASLGIGEMLPRKPSIYSDSALRGGLIRPPVQQQGFRFDDPFVISISNMTSKSYVELQERPRQTWTTS